MDWTGNTNSVFKTLGASNHCDKERQNEDFYATDPIAIDKLLKHVTLPLNLWECACGQGDLAKRLVEDGFNVFSSDLVDRGYGHIGIDFLKETYIPFGTLDNVGIITNPPYKDHLKFIEHALDILPDRAPCIMLLKTTALEGKKRFDSLYKKGCLKAVYQFVERLMCAKNGDFETAKKDGSAVSYAWFWFEKGNSSDTIIKWI